MRTHATSCIGETSLQNCQRTKEYLGNIRIFLLLKPNFPHTKFELLQRLSTFFNGFLIFFNGFPFSSMAFQLSSMAFRFSSLAFCFPRNPRKFIYGGKYTKDHYLSFLFPPLHSLPELCNTRYNTQHTPVVHLCSQQCAISKI